MKPAALADAIAKAIIDTSDNFVLLVENLQEIIYNKLLIQLKNLDLDAEGYIRQTGANREILARAEGVVNDYLPGTQLNSALSEALGAMPAVDALNNEYFSGISESFRENRIFIRRLQQSTIQSLESNVLGDGLISQVRQPLVNILDRSVNSGGQFSGFLEEVRTFVRGNTHLDGRLISYSRGFLRDSLFQYSRSYQESMTNDLGLNYYLYDGGIIDTTRAFCEERAGKFFHRKEVEAWADLKWAGKNPMTTESSIYIFCGGYGCIHSLIPVSETIVPEDVITRNVIT